MDGTASESGSATDYLLGTALRRNEFGAPVSQSQIDYIANDAGDATYY